MSLALSDDEIQLRQIVDPFELISNVHVVSHHQERNIFRLARLANQIDDHLLVLRVYIRRGFVGKDQFWTIR